MAKKKLKINLSTHPLVEKLHPSLSDVKKSIALTGYLGPSEAKKKIRLYTNLDFDHYYEIKIKDIVHTEPIDKKNKNSAILLFVDATCTFHEVDALGDKEESRSITLEERLRKENGELVFISCRCMCGHTRKCIGNQP